MEKLRAIEKEFLTVKFDAAENSSIDDGYHNGLFGLSVVDMGFLRDLEGIFL